MALFAYNTNGLRNLKLPEAIREVGAAGYDGVELSLFPGHLDPFSFTPADAARLRQVLHDAQVEACCLATGYDTLLSAERFEPSLIAPHSADRRRRIDLIRRAIDHAVELRVPVVNFATGFRKEGVSPEAAWHWLVDGVRECVEHARGALTLAVEPEPGMFVETNDRAVDLVRAVGSPDFRINQDVGHVNVVEDDYLDSIGRALHLTSHIHIEDIRARVHNHLIPGEGEIDFGALFEVLATGGYGGFVSVELYNHGDQYRTALRRSITHLQQFATQLV